MKGVRPELKAEARANMDKADGKSTAREDCQMPEPDRAWRAASRDHQGQRAPLENLLGCQRMPDGKVVCFFQSAPNSTRVRDARLHARGGPRRAPMWRPPSPEGA